MTGPYNQGGANQVRSGGAQTEVWLGRFSEDFSRIEAWHRATTNSGADSYPDMWLDIDRSPFPRRPRGSIGPAAAQPSTVSRSPTPTAARVVLEARLARAGHIPGPPSILPYRHALVVNEYDVVRIVDGQYAHKTMQVAQWAIRDGRVLAEARRTTGAAARLVVERFDAHPELEGERLLTDLGTSDLPLYYEIKP
jgi:hypothetical protein